MFLFVLKDTFDIFGTTTWYIGTKCLQPYKMDKLENLQLSLDSGLQCFQCVLLLSMRFYVHWNESGLVEQLAVWFFKYLPLLFIDGERSRTLEANSTINLAQWHQWQRAVLLQVYVYQYQAMMKTTPADTTRNDQILKRKSHYRTFPELWAVYIQITQIRVLDCNNVSSSALMGNFNALHSTNFHLPFSVMP